MKNSLKTLTLIIFVFLTLYGFYVLFFDSKSGPVSKYTTQRNNTNSTDRTLEPVYSKEDVTRIESHKIFKAKKDDDNVESKSTTYSPLSIYPGFRDNKPEGREKDSKQQMLEERQRERIVAECMQNRGFKYTPGETIIIRHDDNYTTQELLDMLEQPGSDDEYLNQLSETERLAYNLALYGIPDPNAEDAEAHENADPDACRNIASRKIPGIYAIAGELAEERRALDNAIATDMRIEGAVHDWSRCMEAKGFQYESPNAIKTAIGDLEISLRNKDPDSARQQIITTFDPVMAAGKSCDQETGLSDITKTVIYEHEQDFVNEHRDLLEKSRQKP